MVSNARRRVVVVALAITLLVVAAGAVWLSRSPISSETNAPELAAFSILLPGGQTERRYHAYVPADLPERAPVILFLHGSAESGPQLATSPARFHDRADHYGFIAVFPTAVEGTSAEGRTGGWWNAGHCITPPPQECRTLPPTPLRTQVAAVDDVAYLREVIDDLARRYEVDTDRVYAWGHSLGGFMAHRLACDLADHVAAVVSVAGALSHNPCTPSRPVSILVYQADDDLDTPTQGNELFAPVADTVAAWRAINHCDPPQTLPTTPELSIESATCKADTSVDYVLLDEGGHDWVHAPDPVFDWFPHTWQFLQEHRIA